MVAFGRRGGAETGADLEQELRQLERRASRTRLPAEAGSLLSRAGDQCIQAGRLRQGLQYYGRAINTYLEADLYAAARAVCRKLLRVAPRAVRPWSTLAWISIRGDLLGDAERELQEYVEAAIRAAQEPTAAIHLRLMADATPAPELRERIAHQLMVLGDSQSAEALLDRLKSELHGQAEPPSWDEVDQYWDLALRTVIIRSDERTA